MSVCQGVWEAGRVGAGVVFGVVVELGVDLGGGIVLVVVLL